MPPNRILIVDDEAPILNAWKRTLKLSGYSVWTAGNAHDALELCNEHSFDLVILDYIMPSVDGIELLRRIRRNLPLVRSILISGKIDREIDESDISKNVKESIEVDVYLHKPVSNERLLSGVDDLLSRDLTDKSWKNIAQQSIAARNSKKQKAKEASKSLKRFIKK